MGSKFEARRPRKILRVKPTKYEGSEQIHRNKRYWNNVFNDLSSSDNGLMEKKEFKVLSEVLPIDLCHKVCSILNIEAPPSRHVLLRLDCTERTVSRRRYSI